MAELPADLPAHISEPAIKRILAGLLRIHAEHLEKAELTICLRGAYDVYAIALKEDHQQLSEEVLNESIPGWVFDWAVKKKWLPYPPQRRVRAPIWFFGDPRPRGPLHEPVPERELTTTLGTYRMTDWYKADVIKRVEGRIAYWQAEALTQQNISSIGPSPASEKVDEADCRALRLAQVNAFLRACNERSKKRIYKRHIWLAVGHTKGRQFEHWQACDDEATEADDRNFPRILGMKPEDFMALLEQKSLLP